MWLAGAVLALAATAAPAATIYKWTDDTGVTHFSSDPPPSGTDAERIHVAPDKRRFGPRPSARVKQIRCRDFRGALEQLEAAEVTPGERQHWHDAKQTARNGIEKWCGN